MTNKSVKITNQSFRDASGLEVFPDLEMNGIIFARGLGYPEKGRGAAFDEANKDLTLEAIKRGCTHIFEATYEFHIYGHSSNNNFVCHATGTAYIPRN